MQWLPELLNHGIQHILVEGGGRVLQSFIDSGTVDQWHRFTSKEAINEGIPAPESNHNLKAAYKLGKDRYERG